MTSEQNEITQEQVEELFKTKQEFDRQLTVAYEKIKNKNALNKEEVALIRALIGATDSPTEFGEHVVEMLRYNSPKSFLLTTTSLADETFKADLTDRQSVLESGNLEVSPNGKDWLKVTAELKKIKTYALINMDFDDTDVTFSKKLTIEDKIYFDAVCTLINEGREYITPAHIGGVVYPRRVPGETLERIKESLDKMAITRVIFKADEHVQQSERAQRLGYSFVDSEDYLLNLSRARLRERNGEMVDVYRLNQKPVLFEYIKAIGHYKTIDIEMIRCIKGNASKPKMILYRELLRQVKIIEENPRMAGKYTFKTLFDRCQFQDMAPSGLSRMKNYAENALSDWKENGYIADYKRTGDGLMITPNSRKKSLGA